MRFEQNPRGRHAEVIRGLRDRREWRRHARAPRDVIEGHECHIVGNPERGVGHCAQGTHRHQVVGDKDRIGNTGRLSSETIA